MGLGVGVDPRASADGLHGRAAPAAAVPGSAPASHAASPGLHGGTLGEEGQWGGLQGLLDQVGVCGQEDLEAFRAGWCSRIMAARHEQLQHQATSHCSWSSLPGVGGGISSSLGSVLLPMPPRITAALASGSSVLTICPSPGIGGASPLVSPGQVAAGAEQVDEGARAPATSASVRAGAGSEEGVPVQAGRGVDALNCPVALLAAAASTVAAADHGSAPGVTATGEATAPAPQQQALPPQPAGARPRGSPASSDDSWGMLLPPDQQQASGKDDGGLSRLLHLWRAGWAMGGALHRGGASAHAAAGGAHQAPAAAGTYV